MEEELLQDGGAGYGQEENSWRLEGMATPTPSEPLFSSPYKVKGHMHTSPNPAASSRPRPRPTNLNYQSDSVQGPHPQQAVPRSRSEPLLPQLQPGTSANSNTEGGDDQGSVQVLKLFEFNVFYRICTSLRTQFTICFLFLRNYPSMTKS